ncbi:dynein axonemal heavy chain 7-like [Diabrotica virgifera virgifera]|uniref:Dynein heavy chain 7, axonemal-like n=1 Tax=Diabrotica virgifera virgifera TaxID=50390 RepID=A0A6P7F771_DIAVI|nr:dynein axonemal heavy chain 7-like [Diabrotica virgifera virgifera]
MNNKKKVSYQFSKIPMLQVEKPITTNVTREFNKILGIRRSTRKKISDYMCQSAIKARLKSANAFVSRNYLPLPVRPLTAKDFKKLSEQRTENEMSRFQEKAIRKRIKARGLEDRYADLVSQFIKEVKLDFITIVHYAGMNMKIKDCHPEQKFQVAPYRFVGKTENYKYFLSIQRQLKTKWILHYLLVRKIKKECVINLPHQFFKLHFTQILDIEDIEYEFKGLTQRAAQYVQSSYLRIISFVENEKLKRSNDLDQYHSLKTSTGVLTLHISSSISQTLEEIVEFTVARDPKPYLFLGVTFTNQLVLEPTPDDVIKVFHKFIDNILAIKNEVFDLESSRLKGNKRRPVNLYITDEFVTRCKEEIKNNINKQFEPILEYLSNINDSLSTVYKDLYSEEFFESIMDMIFENGCSKINFYREYLDKVMFIPDFEFFRIAKVSFIDYKNNLHAGLHKNINLIFEKLSSQHLWEVNDLCETFEYIKMRAQTKPETTEELIEIGKFMLYVRNEQFQTLECRVGDSLSALCKIIDLGTLEDEHMQLNAKSIQWLTDIIPIMEEQSTTFDSLKYDAEEKLQKVVEDVSELVKKVFPLLVILDEMDNIDKVKKSLNFITLHMKKIREIETQIHWINQEEVTLSFPKSTYTEYEELKNYVYPFHHLLNVCLEVQQNLYSWQDGPFDMLDYDSTKVTVEKYQKELSETYKTYRQKLRQAQDDNISLRFKGTVDDPDILNWPAPLKLCGTALRRIEAFEPSVKVMKIVCNHCLRKRHWEAMSEIAGTDVTPNAGTTLRKIMQVDFFAKMEEYEIVSDGATKEQLLLDQLKGLQQQWEKVNFTIAKHKIYDIDIIIELDEIETIITDHNTIIRDMKSSVFVTPHEIQVNDFISKIAKVQETISNWYIVQNILLKLYPIVSLKELRQIIPKETELLDEIITVFKQYLSIISKEPNVIKVIEDSDIAKDIVNSIENLELVFVGVVGYLDKMRDIFPRFYFISNEEFIKAISNSKEMLITEHFLNKLFQNIHHLKVTDNKIVAVVGNNGEELNFRNILEVNPTLEATFKKVEEEIRSVLKLEIVECYKVYKELNLKTMLSKYIEQVIRVALQCYWTENIKMALCINSNKNLEICLNNLETSLSEKISFIKEDVEHQVRLKIKNLIVTDMYTKEVITKILNSNQISIYNFEWEVNFKYSLQNDHVKVMVMNSCMDYIYEYLGSDSYIITPNTERCFRTLINAYRMNYSGLLQGQPDGGKFETVKALAGIFGNFLVKFVCNQNVGSVILEKFLKGSLLCGSWICFENFTNLQMSVMSGLSECLFNIEQAKKRQLGSCLIGSSKIAFRQTSFIAISTTNHSCGDLPENFKKYFRTITMLHPDNDKISEIVLYSAGFTEASILSKKISCVFISLQDTLSSKGKYYFGLSKFMKILRESKNLKIKHRSINENDIIFTVLTNVLSREVSNENIKEFHSILHHVFPGAIIIGENNSLMERLKTICEHSNLSWTPQFGLKTLEVYECIQSMSCSVLVGKSSNKTTIIRLCQTLTQDTDGAKLNLNFLVPNCYNYQILYGYSSNPNEWMDGLITTLFRGNIAHSSTEKTWTIFDGDINPDWIDNMMSILKERKLFLESGEILEMNYLDRVIFETDSLQNTTPSLVSHSTIIYIDQLIPVWKAIVNSWVASCTSDWIQGFQQQISDMCCWVVPPCLEFFQKYCHQLCQLSEINLVKNMIAITQLFLDDVCSVNKKEDDLKNLSTWIQATVIQAGIIGLGALLDTPSRQKFDEFYKQLWRGQIQEHPYPSSFGKLEVSLPHDGLITDYQYIYKQRGNWKVYQDLLKSEKIVENPYMYDFLVPTADTMRYSYILTLCLKNKLPILFIGPNCTGKSILIEDTLRNKFNGNNFEVSHLNFNTYFDAQTTQKLILSRTNKRKEGTYYPPKGKKYIIFIDDLNCVSSDKYGNLDCLELLRQYLDHDLWYDFKNFSKIVLKDANLVSAMSLLDSNYPLKLRFLRHFYVFGINEFSDETVSRIFTNTMLHIWRQNGFPGDIGNIVSQIVDATFCIYKKVLMHYQPTLTRSYYHFNLNEFSSVIKGCTLLKKETYDGNKKIYIKLWIHEIFRVFGDRLTHLENNILETEIKKVLDTHFNESLEEIGDTYINKIVLSTVNDKDHFKYEEITDSKVVIDLLVDELNKYNVNNIRKLNIIFFEYALEKIFKISRILSLTPGNCIFLGSNGLGRSILTKLVSYVYNYICFQPTITQNFTIEHWKSELKLILKEAGAIEHKSVFIVNERDLLEEAYLQYIEMLLQNGDISDIFNIEEKQEILELTRLSAQGGNRNIDISSSDVFLHFNKSCKLNLHLVLCFSADGKSLRRKLRNFPSLLKCQIMFWDDWPDEALQQVAEIRISSIEIIPEYKSKSLDTFLYFHRDFQQIAKTLRTPLYVSPLCFIHLINIFIDIYNNEKNIIENKRKRFSQGLAKLSYASSQILDMQKVLAEYKPQLAEMTAKAIEMTEQIALETIEVEKASELVRQDEKIASEQAIVAQILKSECEAELAQAIPILEDAISALNTLKPSDITLVKSMKNPPDAIKLVMAAVCVIKDVKPDRIPDPSTGRKTYDYWGPSKRILGDMNFLQSLKDFDKDNIKAEIMVKIRKEFLPHKDFKPHVVAKASSAAEGLCKWIIAMDMYDKVAKEVAPKKEKLGKAEKEYADTMAILNEKKEEVKRIEEKLAGLNALLEDANKKQVKLQLEVDFCNRKLASAQKLIGSLGEEQIRWTKAVENLEKQNVLVLGNILLTIGIITYLAPIDFSTRSDITDKWRLHISNYTECSKKFNISESFSSKLKIDMRKQGDFLRDDFFLQNILIYDFSKLFSIFIDPDYHASTWIRKIERRNNLTITTFSDEEFLTKLTKCVRFGKPLMIHQIKNHIPAYMHQFISKDGYTEDEEEKKNTFIFINGKPVLLDARFRLYLVCNIHQPNFFLEVFNRVTVINFIVTSEYLRKHFLRIVTQIEKPETRKLKKETYKKINKFETEITKTQNEILETLCESEADILEDEVSIRTLEEYKIVLKTLRDKYQNARSAEKTIQDFMDQYQTVATFVANMYFCVVQLRSINHIYQFSFDWFDHLYYQSIINSEKSKIVLRKCENINKNFIYQLYRQLNYSLYENDKFVVLLLLTIYVLRYKKEITEEEISVFLKQSNFRTNKITGNIVNWEMLNELNHIPAFFNFVCDIRIQFGLWKDYILSEETCKIPEPWQSKLTSFQKLILQKYFKPKNLQLGIKNLIKAELGRKFVEHFQWTIDDIYNESYSLSPILHLQTESNDFNENLYILLEKKKVTHTFRSFCISDHSTSPTDILLEEARQKGFWLLFQNCHLNKGWLEDLEKKLVQMNYENTNENFRLWLSAEPTTDIPLELLQNSIKVVYSYPSSFKQTVQHFINKKYISEYFSTGCPGKQEVFTKFLYGLICFHGALIKRRVYDRLFWKPCYNVNENDLKMSIRLLQLSINEAHFSHSDIEKSIFLIGNYQYGTQLNTFYESNVFNNLLNGFLNPEIMRSKNYFLGNVREYGLPKKCDYSDYLKLVRNLPEFDNHEIYGISETLEAIYSSTCTKTVIQVLSNTICISEVEQIEYNDFKIISDVDQMLVSLPEQIEVTSCSDYVIESEVKTYNSIRRKIRETLVLVKQSLSGLKPLTIELENISLEILRGNVPNTWKKWTYFGSSSLSEFMTNLVLRINYFKNLTDNNNYWLAAFLYPKALFCKIKLDFSLKYLIPAEQLSLDFRILRHCENFIEGIKITGVSVTNAEWDAEDQCFYEISSKFYNSFSSILLTPNNCKSSKISKFYELPLYQSSDLKLFIYCVKLQFLQRYKHWLKRGVRIVSHVCLTEADSANNVKIKNVALETQYM